MNVGDLIDPSGYERVATIAYAEESGRVLVCHNNGTHLLVFNQPFAGHEDPLNTYEGAVTAYHVAAYPYYENEGGDYAMAYRLALEVACALAVSR